MSVASFASVADLSAYLDSGVPFDLNHMRAAIAVLVQRAVDTDAKLAPLLATQGAERAGTPEFRRP